MLISVLIALKNQNFVSRIFQNESFNQPFAITLDSSGNIYIAESRGQIIRKISNENNITILAGTSGQSGSDDGQGTSLNSILQVE